MHRTIRCIPRWCALGVAVTTGAAAAMRRVHGPGTVGDAGHWAEEFSLDGFEALLALAARRAARKAPRVLPRFPFLVGDHPAELPGLDELQKALAGGCALVATADPIHHGHGYGTPPERCLRRDDPATEAYARWSVEEGFGLLARGDLAGFLGHAAEARSDFRNAGPVLASLLGGAVKAKVLDLVLVDYSDVLGAPEPTWVAGALAVFDTT